MIYIHLVKLDLSTPVYLTDAHRDFEYNGKTYIAGKLDIKQSVKQKAQPSANDFSMTLSAVDQTLVSAFANFPYKGKQCLVLSAVLNDDESIASVSTWLDGELNKYTFNGKEKQSTLKVSVSSIFAAFESINKLNITEQFKDTINDDQTLYWGKSAPNFSSGGGVGGGGQGGGGQGEDVRQFN